MELVFVRHAESIWNAEGRWQGQSDVALSDRGRAEIDLVAARLGHEHFDRIVSSDLSRAHQTALGIAGARPLETAPAFREMNLGAWCGLPHAEVEARFKDQLRALVRGEPMRIGGTGETLPEFGERVLSAITRLVAEAGEDDRVLVVTHGGAVRVVLSAMLDLVTRHRPLVGTTNTAVTRVRATNDGARELLVYNDDRHLGRDDPDTDEVVLGPLGKDRLVAHLGLDVRAPIAAAAAGAQTRLVGGKHPQLRRYAVPG